MSNDNRWKLGLNIHIFWRIKIARNVHIIKILEFYFRHIKIIALVKIVLSN